MKPVKFEKLVMEHGEVETYATGQVFHAQDFPDKLFLLTRGYVKRYQARKPEQKVLELIYGPGHIISLSQLYKKLFGVDQNQENFIYIYQAMTDIEMRAIDGDLVIRELEKDPELYKDFFYESGIKLKSNIFRLASNSIEGDDKKVAHQLTSLAYEFGGLNSDNIPQKIELPVPQSAVDLAEQLHMSEATAQAVLDSLVHRKIIVTDGSSVTILDLPLLKDIYL